MLQTLRELFSYDFMIYALVAGSLISLCASLLGVSLVLKRFSMIGDGLSHVGFGTMAVAAVLGIAPLYLSVPVVVLCAFLLLRASEGVNIKGDASIGLVSTGALAIGVMVISTSSGMNIDIYNYMFGSILTMSKSDVALSVILSVAVLVLFAVFYNSIFAVTFDESFSHATGTNTKLFNMLIAALTAVTIVVGMRIMGAMLISSLLIIPPLSSMRLCKSFRSVVICSCAVSLVCFLAGVVISCLFETPTGASVVCVNLGVFIILSAVRALLRRPVKAQ